MLERFQNFSWQEQLGKCFATEDFAIAGLDEQGGSLAFRGAKDSQLDVPAGALEKPTVIYMHLLLEPCDQRGAFVSPVYQCGPDGIKFNVRIICFVRPEGCNVVTQHFNS